ncbi:MAG: LPS export ABC transporter periplasmic protein LptC [Porticoccaceae bacterium]
MIRQLLLLVALGVLIGGFLLVWDSPPESFLKSPSAKVERLPDADSYMENITSYKFSAAGHRAFTLHSAKGFFYDRQSRLVLDHPSFQSTTAEASPELLNVTADRGELQLTESGDILQLGGNVKAQWLSTEGLTDLRAEALTYLIDKRIARAQQGFKLTSPQAELSGEILSADFENGITEIQSGVRAVYESL